MPQFSAVALATMQRQLGHITAKQLAVEGIGRTARARLVDDGVLDHPFKSVYRVATRRPTFEQRLLALSLAHPSGFVTGPTLGGYRKLRRMPRASLIHFCVPHGLRIDEPDGVHLRQSANIHSTDVCTLANGMRVASWARLLFDLASVLTKANLMSVIDQVLREGHCSLEELGAIATRLCHPNRPGSELFARTLMERGGRRPVESHPELIIMNGLLARGVPVEPQHADIRLPTGRRVRVDLAVPAVRWGVEVDVHPSHGLPVGVVRDKQRDRQLHRVDWQVEHVSEEEFADLDSLLDELAVLYRDRVVAVAA